VTKHDVDILLLTLPVYKRFERPSYSKEHSCADNFMAFCTVGCFVPSSFQSSLHMLPRVIDHSVRDINRCVCETVFIGLSCNIIHLLFYV